MKYKILSYNKKKNGVRVDYIKAISIDDAYMSMIKNNPTRSVINITCIDLI